MPKVMQGSRAAAGHVVHNNHHHATSSHDHQHPDANHRHMHDEAQEQFEQQRQKLGKLARALTRGYTNTLGPDGLEQKTEMEQEIERLREWAQPSENWTSQGHDDATHWTKTNRFKGVIGCIVIVNAMVLGVETDHGKDSPEVFNAIEHVFCAIFAIELLLHFCVEGPRDYFSDQMNWLDFVLVVMSITDVWIIAQMDVNVDLKVLSIFRIFRLVRMVRLLKLVQMFKELTIMVQGLIESISTLFWALVFLAVLIYVGSLVFRHIIGKAFVPCKDGDDDCKPETDPVFEFNPDIGDQQSLFGAVDKTMLTLFCCVTEGCGEILRPTILTAPVLAMLWLPFLGLTCYGVLTLIVAIVCETCLANGVENDRDMAQAEADKSKIKLVQLLEAFQKLDVEKTGAITHEEFWRGIGSNEEVGELFLDLGLNEEEGLFSKLDAEDVGKISFSQFFDGLYLILKGQQIMMAKDVVGPQLLLQGVQLRMNAMTEELEKNIKLHDEEREQLREFYQNQLVQEESIAQFKETIDVATEELEHIKSTFLNLPTPSDNAQTQSGAISPRNSRLASEHEFPLSL